MRHSGTHGEIIGTAGALRAQEAAVVRKAAGKLLPFLCLCYLVAYLDRSNLGVAALAMMPALGLDAAQFGIAAGVFFVGYFIGELPSNLLLVRYGARRWIARIMISWGLVAAALVFVSGYKSLLLARILLGVAEAGFAPGIVVYLAFWFPKAYRARIFGIFMVAIPGAVVVGAPISAALLYLDKVAGLAGWQWLFVVEALPAIVLGFACLYVLPDDPAKAHWLTLDEKAILAAALNRDRPAQPCADHAPVRKVLASMRTWQMTIVDIGLCAGSYGVVFFLPQIFAGFGGSVFQTGALTTVPFLAAGVSMVVWGWHSDVTAERRWHLAGPMFLAAAGFVLAGTCAMPVLRIGAFVMAAAGVYMGAAIFWQFVPDFFESGANAAAAVAIINMTGNLAGFIQPSVMGALKVITGDFAIGLILTGVLLAITGVMALHMARAARHTAAAET